MSQQSTSEPGLFLEVVDDGHNPPPSRPGRDRMPKAVELNILLSQIIEGDYKTIVDSRGSGIDPKLNRLIVDSLAMNVTELGGDLLAGVANSGTQWVAALGLTLRRGFCNVLVDGRRQSGLRRQVEPDDIAGRSAVLVDNWLSTGKSLERAAEILMRHDVAVVGIAVISAATDYLSFTSPHLDRCPVNVMWPKDMLLDAEARMVTEWSRTCCDGRRPADWRSEI